MIIHIIIGAPNKAVTEFIGSVDCVPGNCDITSQRSITVAPHKIDIGMTTLWLLVQNNRRVRCGMVIPINAIGPVNAVLVPVSIAVIIII